MLRALAALLIGANLLFFAWARGWLDPAVPPPQHGQREPARLAAQLNADTLRIVSPQAASAAAASVACVEAGPFNDADVGSAEQALIAAGLPGDLWKRRELQPPPVWLVYMGRFNDAAQRRARSDALQKLRVAHEALDAPAELAPGLVLSRHGSREDAERALAAASAKGVKTARAVALPPPPPQHWLRVPRADATLQARLGETALPGGTRFHRCPR
ncbi:MULTISPECIES: hypothetical protein [Rubrivivax]|uniref:SPOR domain-containing protein n=1 Tax=Rubrivivax benzoatilyticus TaxID=316997 RepID=A0ABX0I1N0_9BURK|nr:MULTISPECIES: hypothetical protein [Rubrivivax]MCD0422377.1 hypothetical protein [Rubrivivax sp. JA1024]EGJ09193.1 putative signal peptide protein [Rubrivivax benzoatilyticus JA2 = ATCC BAA-35]MCC9596532.1 hypothetical protein [Rubrivivax sp. JA1055]MCC9648688.1 hypothetical protein [Rubrivivax sp. JA1029]NHL00048.1 hypothetical protein [Rubrivivax benzoatilyticus]